MTDIETASASADTGPALAPEAAQAEIARLQGDSKLMAGWITGEDRPLVDRMAKLYREAYPGTGGGQKGMAPEAIPAEPTPLDVNEQHVLTTQLTLRGASPDQAVSILATGAELGASYEDVKAIIAAAEEAATRPPLPVEFENRRHDEVRANLVGELGEAGARQLLAEASAAYWYLLDRHPELEENLEPLRNDLWTIKRFAAAWRRGGRPVPPPFRGAGARVLTG